MLSQTNTSVVTTRIDGYTVVRVLLGLLLLTAGALKGYQVATEPTANADLFTNKTFLMLLIEGELLYGLWLIFGLAPHTTRVVSIGLFSVFAIISFGRAISGEASCGCFGSVTVSPWITTTLDLTAVVALLRWRPQSKPSQQLSYLPMVLTSWLLLGTPLGLAMHNFEPNSIDAAGGFTASGDLILLEPEQWLGGAFPLSKHIETETDLTQGDWIVVLYHHDCPKCQEALPKYRALAQSLENTGAERRVALIEVPPFAPGGQENAPAIYGKLPESKDWFVQAPVEILVSNSKVKHVSQELDSIGDSAELSNVDLAQLTH